MNARDVVLEYAKAHDGALVTAPILEAHLRKTFGPTVSRNTLTKWLTKLLPKDSPGIFVCKIGKRKVVVIEPWRPTPGI